MYLIKYGIYNKFELDSSLFFFRVLEFFVYY